MAQDDLNPFQWPDQQKVALNIVVAVEWWGTERHSGFFFPFPPDATTDRDTLTVTDREYGYRVGLSRLLDLFDRYGIKTTMVVSGLVAEKFPHVVRELMERGHEIAAHGYDQNQYLISLTEEQERQVIQESVRCIEETAGQRPTGWMSPGCRATSHTSRILVENGFDYHSDSLADDLPYWEKVGEKRIVVVPYSMINNDYKFFVHGNPPMLPSQMVDWLRYEFDALYEEGGRVPRMMSIGLHHYVSGRPGRAKALEEFLRYAKGFSGVWFARRDEIAKWWMNVG